MKYSHSMSEIFLHLCLVTKYRCGFNLCDDLMKVLLEDYGVKWLSCKSDLNHFHILFEYSMNMNLSYFVNRIKSDYSRLFRRYNDKEFRWSSGYYIKSVGSMSVEKVKLYIENNGKECK